MLKRIIIGDDEDTQNIRGLIVEFLQILSSLDKRNEDFDPECHQLLMSVRQELSKIRELSEEELRELESGEDASDFGVKQGIAQTRQGEIEQGWTARGRRKAHGGKKSIKKNIEIRIQENYKCKVKICITSCENNKIDLRLTQ
jgi:hypothetical protein